MAYKISKLYYKMAYKISKLRGRPKGLYKVRSIKGITPKGFKFYQIKGKKIIYKRKK